MITANNGLRIARLVRAFSFLDGVDFTDKHRSDVTQDPVFGKFVLDLNGHPHLRSSVPPIYLITQRGMDALLECVEFREGGGAA